MATFKPRTKQIIFTTEQLAEDAIQTVKQMTPQEKAEVRRQFNGIFVDADREFLRAVGIAPTILADKEGVRLAKALPPILDGHYRVRTSDGALHDIPAGNIERARQIDADLIVLNPYDFWN